MFFVGGSCEPWAGMTPRVCVGWWWQQWQSHLQVLGTGLSLLAGLCVHVRTEISPCELDGSKCRLRQQSCRGCPPPAPHLPCLGVYKPQFHVSPLPSQERKRVAISTTSLFQTRRPRLRERKGVTRGGTGSPNRAPGH